VVAASRRIERVGRVEFGTLVHRAVRLRCPACGEGVLYARPFMMRDACACCGLVYEAEHGFFVGAIYVNYAVTVVVGLGSALLANWLHPMSLAAQLAIAVPLMLAVPVLFFHHSRSLWLALNAFVSGLERRTADRQ
jgi:uncharacterized protein (DUF983 family)